MDDYIKFLKNRFRQLEDSFAPYEQLRYAREEYKRAVAFKRRKEKRAAEADQKSGGDDLESETADA